MKREIAKHLEIDAVLYDGPLSPANRESVEGQNPGLGILGYCCVGEVDGWVDLGSPYIGVEDGLQVR